VLGAILVFAVLTTLITSIFVYYLPIIKKNAEFEHEKELIDRFLEIVNGYPNCDLELRLGGGGTVFNPMETSATLETNVSGYLILELWNGSTLLFKRRVDVCCINLSIYNTKIENVKVSYCEGGVVLYQGNSKLLLKPPSLDKVLLIGNGSLTLYNYTTGEEEIAGNGVAFVSVRAKSFENLRLGNVTEVTVSVYDNLFERYWNDYLIKNGFHQISSSVWALNLNGSLSLSIYNVTVYLY